jgi:hypothetical protein
MPLQRLSRCLRNGDTRGMDPRSPEPLALRSGQVQARHHPLTNRFPLKFGQGREDVQCSFPSFGDHAPAERGGD